MWMVLTYTTLSNDNVRKLKADLYLLLVDIIQRAWLLLTSSG